MLSVRGWTAFSSTEYANKAYSQKSVFTVKKSIIIGWTGCIEVKFDLTVCKVILS